MRILVTGATGFIGSHLVQCLATRRKHELFAAVRPGREWSAPTGVIVVPWDLCRQEASAAAPADIDAVVHLGQANVPFPDAAVELHGVNAGSTLVLLDWARRAGARAFLLASSGSAYGFGDRPFQEDDPLRPADFYGLTKDHAEQLVGAYRQYVGTCVLRLFAPYGPGQTSRLVSGLIGRVREGRPVTLRGGGRPRFNPIFIGDVLDVLELVLTLEGHHTLNVGGEEALSIGEMAEIIGQELGLSPVFEKAAGGPPGDIVGNIDRLRGLLGPRQLIPFREGIRAMLRGTP